MGRKEEILILLDKEPLTTKDISSKLSISEANIRSNLNRLKMDNKIYVIGVRDGYKLYSTHDPIKLLSFLNDFFKENVSYLAKNQSINTFIIQNEEKFKYIEEMTK